MTDPTTPLRTRRTALVIATVVFAVIAVLALVLWWSGRRYVETDNAYANARQVVVTALIPAPVTRVAVDDTQIVKAGDILVELDATDARALRIQADAQAQMARRKAKAFGAGDQPEVTAADAQLQQAQTNESRTVIRAPVSGTVARLDVGAGQYVLPGMALMTIIPGDGAWVDANFKESQLRQVRVGQPVTVTSDLYGKAVVFRGTVAGISGGTGATLALIPAQNATGNWIKVVQRIPVRITLDPRDVAAHPLRQGMTMTARIDTGAR